MRDRAQIVIIGAGVMGASVAYHLTANGLRDVLLLEQAPQPASGTTARSAAGVRHEFSSVTNVRLSRYSVERIKHFNAEVGGDAHFRQIGYLFLITSATDWQHYQQNTAMQRAQGVRVELLSPTDAVALVPHMAPDDLIGAVWGPDDGYCDPRGLALGYLDRAQEQGAQLRCSTQVTGITVQAGQVQGVETVDGFVPCDVVVNAAGAWAGHVAALAGLDVPVRPVRRCVYVTEPLTTIPRDIPLTIDVGSGFWMRKADDNIIMGLARPDEPSSYQTDVDWDWQKVVAHAGQARFPILKQARLAPEQCWGGLYEVTPDSNPILGRHPALPNYVDVSGFSGHGIMHAPAAGLLIAEEILDGQAHTIPIDDLRITRFAQAAEPEHNVF
jgi:sarcosine oxidase subunit beta